MAAAAKREVVERAPWPFRAGFGSETGLGSQA
jgi:hypothetical protein